jgi:hypothetical protein
MSTNFSLEFKKSNNDHMFTLMFTVDNSTKLVTKVWNFEDNESSLDILLPITGPTGENGYYNGAQLLSSYLIPPPPPPNIFNGFDVYGVTYRCQNTLIDRNFAANNAFDFSNGWTFFDGSGILINPNLIPFFTNEESEYYGYVLSVAHIRTDMMIPGGPLISFTSLIAETEEKTFVNLSGISTTLTLISSGGGGGGGIPLNPCFNKGTKILCLNKENTEDFVEIEKLNKGDLVKTYLHGYKKVEMIGRNTMKNDTTYPISSNCMYVLHKEKFQELTEDLLITGNHSILVNELTQKEAYLQNLIHKVEKLEDKTLLLTACSEKAEQVKNNNEFTYYHIVLENESKDYKYGIFANGLLCETISQNEFNKHNLMQ